MNRIRLRFGRAGRRSLDDWLTEWYPSAYRTAYLILLDRHEAERAVHEAFLRAWRMRAAVPGGASPRIWVFRAVVSACSRRLASSDPGRAGDGWTGPPGRLAGLADLTPDLRRPLALMAGGLDAPAIADITRRRPEAVATDLAEVVSRLEGGRKDPLGGPAK